ncbi:hypothetical protein DMN91_007418 [Ooceraea biroi]|uniref:Uncharacterized protein n=1 Tax=Ooceraea biroi TaxID=2015173 RepID=A0A3L8DK32_OOCBI|nr:hypothetical protein DMN91_007418 [Ooceraea biroi]
MDEPSIILAGCAGPRRHLASDARSCGVREATATTGSTADSSRLVFLQLFISPKTNSGCSRRKCSPDARCRARAVKLERVSTLQGVRVIEVLDTCECAPEASCKREPYIHLVHSGTPHQAVVDVGVCIGHCGKGDEVYQVVENCGCAGNCHRMDHMETVLDYSEVTIKEGTNTTDVRPVIRQINVGQCVGTCPGNETETCLLRDKKEPSRCLAGLYSKQHSCTPARFKVHEYRTRRGARREIIQITQCACV